MPGQRATDPAAGATPGPADEAASAGAGGPGDHLAHRMGLGLRRRWWRHRAAVARRRRSGPDPTTAWPGVDGPPPGRDGTGAEPWLATTAGAHLAWRAAAPPADGCEVTVVCVTNRPRHLDAVVANHQRQRHPATALLVVANSSAFDLDAVRRRLEPIERAEAIQVDEDEHLGTCLNLALERCTTRYLAKVDDDDRYGAEYLGDALRAHRLADAVVVGKHSYIAHLAGPDLHVVRFPGRERFYTSTVAGGTLVVDLERLPAGVRFPDHTVGEDTGFVDACARAGGSVFAADRFNYVQHRGAANTWQASDRQLLARSAVVDPSTPAGTIEL